VVRAFTRIVFILGVFGFLRLSHANQNVQRDLRELQSRVSQQSALENQTAYYFYLFAYEGPKNKAQDSHTFASFVRVAPNKKQYWSTISWLPKHFYKTKKICVFKDLLEAARFEIGQNPCGPEEGTNYSLGQTLQMASETQKKVTAWGPYKIDEAFYKTGQDRIHYLNSGAVKYLADDRTTRRKGIAVNCMHAVSDLEGHFASNGGFLNFGYGVWGVRGSKRVYWHLANRGYLKF